MNALWLAAALGFGSHAAPSDTTLTVSRGDGLVIENLSGEISVRTWERDRLQLRDSDGGEPRVLIRRAGGRLVVEGGSGRKGVRRVEIEISIPSWMAVSMSGRSLDVTARSMSGPLTVRNLSGDIRITDARGPVTVATVQGEIDVRGARGPVTASSQADDVYLSDASGVVDVHSGRGDLTLRDIRSASVRAETQEGDIDFSGVLMEDGSYGFSVHDGDARIAIPEGTDARVSVSTFDGEFESDFPVRVERFRGGRAFDFTLGTGSARLEIEVFDGEIQLRKRDSRR
jgi:DUF4097 and DUF4098 domain-containing protein YvlB